MTDEVWQAMADIGPQWAANVPGHVQRMIDVFTPLHACIGKHDDVRVVRDLRYGPHARQVLDVFAHRRAARRPVVLFVHGGAFVAGSRDRSTEIYSNVLHYFARFGCIGVNMEYRLAPDHPFPSGSVDVALALDWVREHIGELGGDPENIFLIGHSAGAAHVTTYSFDPLFDKERRSGIRGLIVVSGRVRADIDPMNPNAAKVAAYYGTDASAYAHRSPVAHAGRAAVPVMIAFAEYENPLIDVHCLELAYRVAAAARRAPDVLRLPRHNHTSIIAHVNTTEDVLGERMRAFIESNRRARSSERFP
ncbi:alpha/beta hydrolase [Burkholderia stagnalis]